MIPQAISTLFTWFTKTHKRFNYWFTLLAGILFLNRRKSVVARKHVVYTRLTTGTDYLFQHNHSFSIANSSFENSINNCRKLTASSHTLYALFSGVILVRLPLCLISLMFIRLIICHTWVPTPPRGTVISSSKTVYCHCSVLVGSRNRIVHSLIRRNALFKIELK